MPEKNCTAKSLHPIPHCASVVIGQRVCTVSFEGPGAQKVTEEIGALLALKMDNEGKPMYEVTGLKKDLKAPKNIPIPEVNDHARNQ